MWVSKGTLKPESGENIKEKFSGKPASILDTTITLEEFEPKPSSILVSLTHLLILKMQ